MIRVLHRLQPMCDGNDRAFFQLFTKYLLYVDCSLHIDRRRCLMPTVRFYLFPGYVATGKGTHSKAHDVPHQV